MEEADEGHEEGLDMTLGHKIVLGLGVGLMLQILLFFAVVVFGL